MFEDDLHGARGLHCRKLALLAPLSGKKKGPPTTFEDKHPNNLGLVACADRITASSPHGVVECNLSTSHAHRIKFLGPTTTGPWTAVASLALSSYPITGVALHTFSLMRVYIETGRNPQRLQPASTALQSPSCARGSYIGTIGPY